MIIRRLLRTVFYVIIMMLLLGSSNMRPGDQVEQIRAYTRNIEFDYIVWIFNALGVKADQAALGTSNYLPEQERSKIVLEYIGLISQIQQDEAQLNDLYSNPQVVNPKTESAQLESKLDKLYKLRSQIGPVAESILQSQIAQTINDMHLSLAGQLIPPILYHSTPLPMALIVSPRNTIRQDADISLVPDLTVAQQAAVEDEVDKKMNVSSLVVGIGGVGVYPTMVMQTSDLNWLVDTVAHEWTHNFLTLRPLGVSYEADPALRTMNETTASIAGKEIGRAVIERYYPQLLPPEETTSSPPSSQPSQPPAFDFNVEMHKTRVNVDQMLAEGKVDQAEAYMEAQRVMFWNHGYHIRKLNQAYFAFYGAYADQPVGAAGADPVGAAVRALRAQSPSLAAFLNQISWMFSFQQLQQAVGLSH
jgi:hypothetical protein